MFVVPSFLSLLILHGDCQPVPHQPTGPLKADMMPHSLLHSNPMPGPDPVLEWVLMGELANEWILNELSIFLSWSLLSSVLTGVKTNDWDKQIFFSQDRVRLKTISPIMKLISRGRHGPLLPHQICFSFLEATRKPTKTQVRAVVLDLPDQRLYEPVEQYLISADVGTPRALPYLRSPGPPSWPYTCH